MKKILVIDIETTGFSPEKHHILEAGLVSLDLESGVRDALFITTIHEPGCTYEEVFESWFYQNSDFGKARPSFSSFSWRKRLEHYFRSAEYSGLTAFNQAFDFRFLEHRGVTLPKKLPDPMKCARDIVKARDKNGRIKNPTVQQVHDYFFSGYVEKHRALDDAMHEAQIIYELYKIGAYETD